MSRADTLDDNPEIIELIRKRLPMGVAKYGHGLRAADDTTEWGTEENSWVEMALEEALDMAVYLATALVRLKRDGL